MQALSPGVSHVNWPTPPTRMNVLKFFMVFKLQASSLQSSNHCAQDRFAQPSLFSNHDLCDLTGRHVKITPALRRPIFKELVGPLRILALFRELD